MPKLTVVFVTISTKAKTNWVQHATNAALIAILYALKSGWISP